MKATTYLNTLKKKVKMELKIVFENELSLDVLDKEFFAILFDQLLKIKEKNGT